MRLNVEITDTGLLKKTIQILSCVIHGHNIRALLRNDTKFLSQETSADMISIYILKDGGFSLDFLSDKKRLFLKLMQKYRFDKHSPAFYEVGKEIINEFSYCKPYYETTNVYDLLKGTLTKEKCKTLSKEISFTKTLLFPLQLTDGKKFGFIAYFYTRKKEPVLHRVKEITSMLQSVMEPLYDQKTSTLYPKCSQIDLDMSRLTDKERDIVLRVIKGISYKEIAVELNISINTLKTHMKSVFSKYGVNSKAELNNRLLMHMA